MSALDTVEKDINIAETWIKSIAAKIAAKVDAGEKIEPELADVVTKTEAFLAAATPAVAGEGLNFPADSVAYAAFVALVASWQAAGAAILTVVKS